MTTSLLQSCFAQPDDLPDSLRVELARRWPGEQVRLFALGDIDARRRFADLWLVLTDRHVVLATPAAGGNGAAVFALQAIPLEAIATSENQEGLSSCVLTLL